MTDNTNLTPVSVHARRGSRGATRVDGGLPVTLGNDGLAFVADVPVRFVWLKDGFYCVLEAGCAYFMRWLARGIVFFEGVDTAPHIGLRKLIARRLCLKMIILLQFLLQVRQKVFHAHLISLGFDKAAINIQNQFFHLKGVRLRSVDNILELLREVDGL